MKNYFDYMVINKIRHVTLINQVNIRNGLTNIKLDVEVKKKKVMNKRSPRIDTTHIIDQRRMNSNSNQETDSRHKKNSTTPTNTIKQSAAIVYSLSNHI